MDPSYNDARSGGHMPDPTDRNVAQYDRLETSESTLRRRRHSPTSGVTSPTMSAHDPPTSGCVVPYSPAPPPSVGMSQEKESPFNAITEDLRNRIDDWQGQPLSGLGALHIFDILSVRRDALVREYHVYLFKKAIICVVEEEKRTLGRFLSSVSGAASALVYGSPIASSSSAQQKGVLRLKGRIYIRHIRQVTDASVPGELSLTIDMEDECLDSFILIFKDRPSLETWRANILALVSLVQR